MDNVKDFGFPVLEKDGTLIGHLVGPVAPDSEGCRCHKLSMMLLPGHKEHWRMARVFSSNDNHLKLSGGGATLEFEHGQDGMINKKNGRPLENESREKIELMIRKYHALK